MTNDIVTRLRAEGEMEPVGDGTRKWEPNLICIEAADEIERLTELAHNLYEETKRCGSLHDSVATNEYEQWLDDHE